MGMRNLKSSVAGLGFTKFPPFGYAINQLLLQPTHYAKLTFVYDFSHSNRMRLWVGFLFFASPLWFLDVHD